VQSPNWLFKSADFPAATCSSTNFSPVESAELSSENFASDRFAAPRPRGSNANIEAVQRRRLKIMSRYHVAARIMEKPALRVCLGRPCNFRQAAGTEVYGDRPRHQRLAMRQVS
jgi:hypothetical protein